MKCKMLELKKVLSTAIMVLCDVTWNLTATKLREVACYNTAIFAFVVTKSSHLAQLSTLVDFVVESMGP
jgi:hypothetical protein